MGSAAAYHLAKRGAGVIGFDRASVPNTLGSSHGESRMIRMAYFEHPDYVPLLRRAYQLWDELSIASGKPLFHRTGIAYVAPPTSEVAIGIQASALKHCIRLDEGISTPGLAVPSGAKTWWEPDSGYLRVEECVQAHAELARKAGAALHENTEVTQISFVNDEIQLETSLGNFTAEKLVITAGPWMQELLPDLAIQAHRVTQSWFRRVSGPAYPFCFAYDIAEGFFYGFPEIDGLLKIACHRPGERVMDPARVSRAVTEAELAPTVAFIKAHLPGLDPVPVKSSVCLYSMTHDSHFIVDRHPENENAVFAGGFSGHGFKFASVMGEILADLALQGETKHPIGFLGRGRL